MLFKSIIVAAICGLATAITLDTNQPVQALGHQKHYKTPLGVDYKGSPIPISKKFLATKNVPFIPHPAGNSSWLGMNLDYKYVKPVFEAVNSTQVPLLNRGESHITIITPPEFSVLASAGITIDQVNKIALDAKIQSSKISVVCLGKEDVKIAGVQKIVYQILVQAPNLVKIREQIFKLYVKQGGNTALFDPRSFWPHVTVGFTSGDVFLEQGVYKGFNVCYRPLTLKK